MQDMKERFGAMPTGSQIIVIDGVNYTVVSHYTGKKDVDRVIREIAEKQALADMSDPVKKKKKSRHKIAGLTVNRLQLDLSCALWYHRSTYRSGCFDVTERS